jgi:DNA-binding MarR family transcriptional regulator
MRDVLWQQPHTWVVAVNYDDRATALKPPADAFFDVVVSMPDWSTNDLTGLLVKRLADEPVARSVLTSVALNARGNPRTAIRALAQAVLEDRDPVESLSGRTKLLDEAAGLGRPHAMLMAELLDRGQASPSDADLQTALGLTRARLTQLLRELLDHDLVAADVARSEGPGRPRTVYRPRLVQ